MGVGEQKNGAITRDGVAKIKSATRRQQRRAQRACNRSPSPRYIFMAEATL